MGKNTEVQHATAKKSWGSGRITALCGATAEAGEYHRAPFVGKQTCPACIRIVKERNKR